VARNRAPIILTSRCHLSYGLREALELGRRVIKDHWPRYREAFLRRLDPE